MIIKTLSTSMDSFTKFDDWVDENFAKNIVSFIGWNGVKSSIYLFDEEVPKVNYYSRDPDELLFSFIRREEAAQINWLDINVTPSINNYPDFIPDGHLPKLLSVLIDRLNTLSKHGIVSIKVLPDQLVIIYSVPFTDEIFSNKKTFITYFKEVRNEISTVFQSAADNLYIALQQAHLDENRSIEFEINNDESEKK
jgi:hypothetical protein